MTLIKADIVHSVRNHLGLSRSKSAKVIESTFEIIKKSMENGENVLIRGFGKFSIKEKKDGRGKNSFKGEKLISGARRIIVFKCSTVLSNKINKRDI